MQNRVQEWIYRLLEPILYIWETTTDRFVKTQAAVEIQAVLEAGLEAVQCIEEISAQITQVCRSPVGTTVSWVKEWEAKGKITINWTGFMKFMTKKQGVSTLDKRKAT